MDIDYYDIFCQMQLNWKFNMKIIKVLLISILLSSLCIAQHSQGEINNLLAKRNVPSESEMLKSIVHNLIFSIRNGDLHEFNGYLSKDFRDDIKNNNEKKNNDTIFSFNMLKIDSLNIEIIGQNAIVDFLISASLYGNFIGGNDYAKYQGHF